MRLSNGHEFTFCCAAGALGFTGDGYWWEQPWRWLGVLRPQEFTIIVKTLTRHERKGNYDPWRPWRCVRLIKGGAVNAMGLPNMGIDRWIDECYPTIFARGYDVIVSIQPTDIEEAGYMARKLAWLSIKGIEVNLSCPNTKDSYDPVEVIRAVRANTQHPVIAKLGASGLEDMIRRIDGYVDAYDLINTVPWKIKYPDRPSPLAPYGLEGGVSGEEIKMEARNALVLANLITKKPKITGGGINSAYECRVRHWLGASAYSLGTVILHAGLCLAPPWRPNKIARQHTAWLKEQYGCRDERDLLSQP